MIVLSNDKSYLGYFNKLVDEYNNSYQCSICKKLFDAEYSALTKKSESSHKAPKFKIDDKVKITKNKNISSKGYTKNWSREIFVIDSILKTDPWTYKIKELKGEEIIRSFYEIRIVAE